MWEPIAGMQAKVILKPFVCVRVVSSHSNVIYGNDYCYGYNRITVIIIIVYYIA